LPGKFWENDFGSNEVSLGNAYIYIPITVDDKVKAFLYLQMHGIERKLNNMERELLFMLPDSLSLIFQHTQLYMMAILDPLTRLYTRNYFVSKMDAEFRDAKNFHLEYTIMMLDIDDFKKFNDTYGHTVGDVVLKQIASTLKEIIGELGMVGRFGGEEFIITLPIGYLSCSRIAEKINKAVNEIKIPGVDKMLSVSIGIASYPYTEANDYLELLDKADSALYVTKSSGKNSFTLYEEKYVS
jgi:diguanylate cyclase (GGDEF)-like protein